MNLIPDSQQRIEYLDSIQEKLLKLGKELIEQLQQNWTTKEMDAISEMKRLEESQNVANSVLFDSISYRDTERKRDLYRIRMRELSNQRDRAHVWNICTDGIDFDSSEFLKQWNSKVRGVCATICRSIQTWQSTYPQLSTVLPVQHFDMMYNIIKRLSNGAYYDVPSEAHVEESFDYVVRLYSNALQELKKQDEIYHCDASFSQAFLDSVFYKKFAGVNTRNSFVKQIYIEMMKKITYNVGNRISTASIRGEIPSR